MTQSSLQIQNPKSKIHNPSPRLHFVHVPTPGDHYSPATGSAVMTVIHGMTAAHAARQLPSTILVSRGTTTGYPPYAAGTTREIDLPILLPSRPQKLIDAALGRTLVTRPFASRQYAAIPAALGHDFEGTVFVHNAPAAMPRLRRELPRATLALYAHNRLFNTYSAREIRRVIDATDALVCVSNFLVRDITTRAGIHSPKLKTVLNGVDTVTFTPAVSAPAGIPTILFLGRILDSKGPDLLLKAAAAIATPDRPFKIRIVGSHNFDPNAPLTPYEQLLRRLAEPIKERVEFVPFVPRDQVPVEYRRATIFVAPSNWDEPFGLTIAEALASGLPCVVSHRGGIPEVAADAALYFPPPDAMQLAAQLAALLDDSARRTDFAARARRRGEFLAWPRRYEDLLAALELA